MSEVTLEQFLRPFSEARGRTAPPESVPGIDTARRPDHVYAPLDEAQAVRAFETEAAKIGIKTARTTRDGLARTLAEVAASYGAQTAVIADDARVDACGIADALHKRTMQCTRWNAAEPAAMRAAAEQADCGITFAKAGVAETASVMQVCDAGSGRCICLLPETHIAVLNTRDIVPRMAQAMKILQDEARAMGETPSNVTFITGPSNTADIELVRVVGVHGPINTAVVLVED